MQPNVPDAATCPDCGTPLPADSPRSLCPACLMRQAMASNPPTQTLDTAGNPPNSLDPIPDPAHLAEKFPQFEILGCLGRGGMGVVYKARQKSLNRLVAIKILPPGHERDARFATRFAREAEMLAQLSHPHIVTIHDFGETGGLFYLVMEFIDGPNLRDLLRQGRMDNTRALAIIPPVCDALQYAHEKGIVHRDIKPENLLLDRDGRIKIADFGIASLAGAEGERCGTPPYMAPEQDQPAGGPVDQRADIHALGAVLYEMLTGERPAPGALIAPSRKAPMDSRLDGIILRALEPDPALRYHTAAEFRTAVETLQTSFLPPVRKRRTTPPPLPGASPKHRGFSPAPAGASPNPRAFSPNPSGFSPNPPGPWRRWWPFLIMIPLGILLGIAGGFLIFEILPHKYEAEAIIEVKSGDPLTGVTNNFFGTEFERIKSKAAVAEVSRRLELSRRWNVDEPTISVILKGIVTTQNIRGTDLIALKVRHTDAELTAAIAETFADVYASTSPGKIIIHERPEVPLLAVSPNRPLLGLIGSALGFFLSLAATPLLIWLLHRRDLPRA